ncbi:restriction endonuclease [Micromonospora fluostatini]|uniref:Restriction endonuclease n=1 Tax=Micromonospora fluostatini TaxID=1629071 RepID=A0ABY2DGE7_9ACTN|nr:restriction endonuclease [Micromonospora fluostatini]
MPPAPVPDQAHLLWPTVQALRTLGGSGSIDEIVETVLDQQGFTEEQQQVLHGDGPRTEIEYRLAWARTYLKFMNLLVNSHRGVWTLTERGRTVRREEILGLHAGVVARQREELRAKRRAQRSKVLPAGVEQQVEDEQDWREELLDVLMSVSPAAFERLAQRLLREAGFISTTVTGRTGDGGIDGMGVYQMSLVSFPVFFQSKRYRGSVGAGAVRDFRGAMAGRGDKGLLITTGTFTADAKAEATRDGAPPVDLIDGRRLCDLLKEYDLGVRTEKRIVEDISVEKDFFVDL